MVRIMQMFADGRSRKVVFLAHCLLNQNAISDGTAVYPAAFRELVQFFLEHQVGIVQLPCPELCCLGLDRGNRQGAQSPVTEENTRIRAAMQAPAPSRMLEDLVESATFWGRTSACAASVLGWTSWAAEPSRKW